MTEIVDNKIQIRDEEIASLKGQISALTAALTQLMSRTELLENTVKRYGAAEFKSEERSRIERLEIQNQALTIGPYMSGMRTYTASPWRTPATLNTTPA